RRARPWIAPRHHPHPRARRSRLPARQQRRQAGAASNRYPSRQESAPCLESSIRIGTRESVKPSAALLDHRAAIRRIVESHRARNARVFGSVLHGSDAEGSDLDLLIDPTPETTLFDIGAISYKLEKLLGIPVDVLTPNALPDNFRAKVLAEARPVGSPIHSACPTTSRTSSRRSNGSWMRRCVKSSNAFQPVGTRHSRSGFLVPACHHRPMRIYLIDGVARNKWWTSGRAHLARH